MARTKSEGNYCALCERNVSDVTLHHLIPKAKGGKFTDTVLLCQPCHTTLHLAFTNKELATTYNSISALQEAEPLQKYLKWIRNKRIEKIANRKKKR